MRDQDVVGMVLGVLCLILAVALVIAIFYLLTLQKALSRVSPRNRLMEPAMVWLMLIPCVNFVWQFFIAVQVPDSLRNEFRERGQDDGSDYGKSIALSQAIIGIVSSVLGNGARATGDQGVAAAGNAISLILSLVGLVLFIMFWVKVANYSAQLAADDGERLDRDRGPGDYDDDRGPPPGGGKPDVPPDAFREGDPGHYQ
jgi:hypothetical protein